MSAIERITKSIGTLVGSLSEVSVRRLVANAEAESLKPILKKLLKDFSGDFYLDFLAVVDYPDEERIEANYSLWFYSLQSALTIKFNLPRNDPAIDSIGDLIPSATFHEQEAYDLMGVTFSGNSDLKRGFLVTEPAPDSYPLRKQDAKKVEQS